MAIIENDIYADLDVVARPTLASLDQLQRVAYLGSFSKTISPNLRVGYVVARQEWLPTPDAGMRCGGGRKPLKPLLG